MRVGMVPICSRNMICRDGNLNVVNLPGLHGPHDIVRNSAGADMHPVRMEIRRVELMRGCDVRGGQVPGRWELVEQLDFQGVPRLHPQGGTGAHALIGAQEKPVSPRHLNRHIDILARYRARRLPNCGPRARSTVRPAYTTANRSFRRSVPNRNCAPSRNLRRPEYQLHSGSINQSLRQSARKPAQQTK